MPCQPPRSPPRVFLHRPPQAPSSPSWGSRGSPLSSLPLPVSLCLSVSPPCVSVPQPLSVLVSPPPPVSLSLCLFLSLYFSLSPLHVSLSLSVPVYRSPCLPSLCLSVSLSLPPSPPHPPEFGILRLKPKGRPPRPRGHPHNSLFPFPIRLTPDHLLKPKVWLKRLLSSRAPSPGVPTVPRLLLLATASSLRGSRPTSQALLRNASVPPPSTVCV